MSYLKDLKGSEWRKWDLQVHTPVSIIQRYGEDDEEVWEKFISDLENLPEEFKVIGINDYLFLDGYEKVLEYKKNGQLKNIDLILPVLEFRIEKFSGVDFGKLKRINLHVIFSDELDIETIKSQFLNGLEQSYKLEKDGNEWNRAITKDSLIALGRKIKESVPPEELSKYQSDLEEGFNNLNVDEKRIFELLERDCFKDKYLIAIGKTEWDSLKWQDSSIATKKTIINEAHVVFTAAESVENWRKSKEKLTEQKVNNLLLDCSDAHYFSTSSQKDRIGNCFTWIKADPTFEGLKQILYEPEERVFIGDEPELIKRVRENKTKFIKTLKINQVEGYDEKLGIWFKNIEIPFNPGLVAIIGNRGNGKSAIADILGLCGNSYQYDDFSFLNKDRFLKSGLAENFEAELEWESGEKVKKNLSDDVDKNAPERVRYLPQNYFEKLTNSLDNYEFEKTLERVVFSHIPEEQKLEKNSFEELINYKKHAVNEEIEFILKGIRKLNEEIIGLEKKAYPDYKKRLENKLKVKQRELGEHEKNKPEKVVNPKEDETLSDEQRKMLEELETLNKKLEETEKLIKQKKKEKATILKEWEDLQNIKNELEHYNNLINKYISENSEKFEKYGLNISKIIKLEIDFELVDEKIEQKKLEIKEIKQKLEEKLKDKEDATKKINNIKEELSEQERRYQQYLEDLKRWEEKRNQLIGDEQTFDTIKWLERELKFIESELTNRLKELRDERIEKTLLIYDKKNELIEVYRNFKDAIDSEISKYKDILGDYEIKIDASLKVDQGFYGSFLGYINQKVRGSFFGKDEGKTMLKGLLEKIDVNSRDSIKTMLNEILRYLECDQREQFEGQQRYITDQIDEKKLKDFYDYVFSLKYLEPFYELKLGNKSLPQLSPGEKGAMLIVFYLMLDKENIPLIIDQPEENLDNESIYKILTHFIKHTKRKRQIIMVTHNPNLAIVGDAEQIIFVNIDKKNGNKFSFEAGSIENPVINKHASDILEGTLKAFNVRRLKYFNTQMLENG